MNTFINTPSPYIYTIKQLTNGSMMFNGCLSLTSFDSELPNLTNGTNMFGYCPYLTSFKSELPNLTNGTMMFYNCSSLTSFESELPSLTDGTNMFQYCKFNYESFKRIANSLPDRTDLEKANIHLGNAINITADQKTEINEIIVNKNWTTTWQ